MKRIILSMILFSTGAFAQFGDAGQTLKQVYGSVGTCTQDANADSFTTTVNADSASGQAVLNVAATTDLDTSGDVVVVHPGGAREEVCLTTAKAAGTITCSANLTFTHTAAQADPVHLTNRLPNTGTEGFADGIYTVFCHNAAGAGLACECIQGGTAITASNAVGETYPVGERPYMTFTQSFKFISCVGSNSTDDVIVDVCKRQ